MELRKISKQLRNRQMVFFCHHFKSEIKMSIPLSPDFCLGLGTIVEKADGIMVAVEELNFADELKGFFSITLFFSPPETNNNQPSGPAQNRTGI